MINDISFPSITSSDNILSQMPSIQFAEHPDRVLVIGNGFDLGLGLQTTYRQFANSSYWPFNNTALYPEGTLASALNVHKDLDRWFDLEELLYQYARKGRTYQTPNERVISNIKEFDLQCFQNLSRSLTEYLDNEQTVLSILTELQATSLRYSVARIFRQVSTLSITPTLITYQRESVM